MVPTPPGCAKSRDHTCLLLLNQAHPGNSEQSNWPRSRRLHLGHTWDTPTNTGMRTPQPPCCTLSFELGPHTSSLSWNLRAL